MFEDVPPLLSIIDILFKKIVTIQNPAIAVTEFRIHA